MNTEHSEVTNNPDKSRFELIVAGKRAVTEYVDQGHTLVFIHTEVPKGLEGKGIGSKLISAGLEYAQQHQKKVWPLCPYAAAYIQRHVEYHYLLADNLNKQSKSPL